MFKMKIIETPHSSYYSCAVSAYFTSPTTRSVDTTIMLNGTPTTTQAQAFGPLPPELLLNILDQLVETCNNHHPVARSRFDKITKTLHSLTLVSRSVHPIATEYLYSNCVWLDCPRVLGRFCTTLGLDHQHQATVQETRRPPKPTFSRYIMSMHISPIPTKNPWGDDWASSIRLPAIINLFNTIGPNLKRLHLNLSRFGFNWDVTDSQGSDIIDPNVYSNMLLLEELILSCDIVRHFPNPPPNIKRLAITFYRSLPSLESLVLLWPDGRIDKHIDTFFDLYEGKSIDIILVDMVTFDRTLVAIRDRESNDTVRIWEAYTPPGFGNTSDEWIWDQGAAGTLWDQKQRRIPWLSEIKGH
ncbi:hypothetical protein COCC4DRAFT_153474 [Bipolaris maydis ATCC 48331]|uniref:F-box domain-containing protein n=2 Tax=Cochliobolus heterostrophus TaxID=5016 RepID=M2UB97_COCH5|nr:uncharacterized protein COCC4DRAFT_153474 [Bipolaris maydis ATCC 48331]EMD85217.1 hypothetical protein COCHEDRAFT_1161649 [Bipolaris maydis C5]KAJ5026974.1 hypothetical protein J3E73DRAFT_391093 [Bipolaris maydis]ENH99328.1 hypothetical protein COCC4DRAFT_153474 [Bipolaris maydis ATCC 48331]KAJ6209255.1 hypothetical protein PSV09DRAFT_1161649 [Bipolaris maydis]KAJ6271723.1 hypothetical protein PSV08DRAFT_179420 [Bipolaris maydis]